MKITLKELKTLIKEAVNEVNMKRYRALMKRQFELDADEQEELSRLHDQLMDLDSPSGEEYSGDDEPLERDERRRDRIWASPSERAKRR